MDIKAIKNTTDSIYIQILRTNEYPLLLTAICKMLKFKDPYQLEEELYGTEKGEDYSEIQEDRKSIQVVLSEQRVHIVIKSPKIEKYRENIFDIINTF